VLDDALLQLVRQHIAHAGAELVDFTIGGTDQRPILRVKVDLPDNRPGKGITVGQCATLSRTLEHALEANAQVGSQYVLEVSSPGMERPVRWPEHWRRFVGRQIRVKARPLGGARTAEIIAVPDDDHVILRTNAGDITVALGEIRQATLVIDWDNVGKP
jgi:ribosome maturation factor RimP